MRDGVQGTGLTRILVTVPNTGWIHRQVSVTLIKLALDGRYHLTFKHPVARPLENNQHHIVGDFLKGDAGFWLSIDADNPPMNNPLDLVALDLDIVGCPTPIWHYTGDKPGERPIYWGAYDHVEKEDAYREHEAKEGLQRVDAISGGCFLVARRVFEHPGMQRGAFARPVNDDGTVERGNDIAFCERARAAGFKVWTHYGYPCRHFKELELTEVLSAFQGAR